jgi:hypothetical protein
MLGGHIFQHLIIKNAYVVIADQWFAILATC